jgi:hypothetical protein
MKMPRLECIPDGDGGRLAWLRRDAQEASGGSYHRTGGERTTPGFNHFQFAIGNFSEARSPECAGFRLIDG